MRGHNHLACSSCTPHTNNKTETVLCNQSPTEFLPQHPPPSDTIYNIYKLKTQSELVCYHHAAAGFPTKPTWLKAITNKQFASWSGLTADAVIKHFPELEETHKGHGRKTRSGLRSTKTTPTSNNDDNDNDRLTYSHSLPNNQTEDNFLQNL